MNVKEKLQTLLTASNNTTGETDTTLTDAVQRLVNGYGGGEEWELINVIEPTEEANALHITKDSNGQPFNLKKALLLVYMPKYTGSASVPTFGFASINNKTTGATAPLVYTAFPSPNVSQARCGFWLVECNDGGKPYHEYLAKSNVSGSRRSIGWSGVAQMAIDYYCNDGTEPAPNGITEIGTAGNLVYSGCYFALYGVRT